MRLLAVLALLPLILSGCGKKGALVPPEALVPAPIADLRVAQKGEQFLVSWSRPTREEAGGGVRDLSGFRVLRREVLPEGEDCEQCPDAYRTVRNVDLEYLREVSRRGNLYFFSDGDVVTGKVYQYKAISLKRDGAVSRDSNKPRKKKIVPPGAPQLQTRSVPGGVELSWGPGALPPETVLIGYNLYRRRGEEPVSPFPINDTLLTDSRYVDRHLDPRTAYHYLVRSIARSGVEVAESVPSNEVTARQSLTGEDEAE